jgi:hypothetical protein
MMSLQSLLQVKALVLLFSVILAGCVGTTDAMIQSTQTAETSLTSEVGSNFPVLASDGSSFYYYSSGARIPLTPSLHWIAVKFVSTDPAEQSAALQGSIVDSQEPGREVPAPEWVLLPLQEDMTIERLIEGINSLRADRPRFRHVNPVFQAEDAEMIVTDQFIAAFPADKSKEEIAAINSSQHVELVDFILGQANTYILRVADEAGLDALSMANLYQESGMAMDAAPNFIRIVQK